MDYDLAMFACYLYFYCLEGFKTGKAFVFSMGFCADMENEATELRYGGYFACTCNRIRASRAEPPKASFRSAREYHGRPLALSLRSTAL